MFGKAKERLERLHLVLELPVESWTEMPWLAGKIATCEIWLAEINA